MARPVAVSIPHALGKQEARRRIDEGFAGLQQNMTGGFMGILSFKQHWEGDRLHFEGDGLGQTIRGRLDVLVDSIQIEIELPEMLASIANLITGRLKKETQKLLTSGVK